MPGIPSPVNMEVIENYPLQKLNTFGINVSARWYAEIHSIGDLQKLLTDERFRKSHRLILGGGSNILFTKNFDGLVIRNRIEFIQKISEDDNTAIVKAGAGINWHSFVLYAISQNFPGIENLSLIPGCIGAAPIQNIGAYGVELKNTFLELEAVTLDDGNVSVITHDECRFGYRDSIFKHEAKDRFAIISVTFRFDKKMKLNTSYGAIEEELKKMHVFNPTIKDVSNAVINIRQSKLPDPVVIGNAGSFFKNPEISNDVFSSLQSRYPGIVGFPSRDKTKVAAGWLIEQSGWKGKRSGNTGMHEKQALVLVNYGNATGKELIDHAKRVQESVKEKFGIELEREVNVV